ncbi:DMT family transporter [Proteiniclasticum sp. SCR006]|uniref:DMT family transporter n=1 Tax=Proteiniclasticum aestuarii TaxID=2817862 RepID=A0A939HAF7_9CLOT|nr:DMT family transporter [Proteiniclasticum aestuarii]MBO1264888.1 DMT family transporter [Proteiniclasticum aestuarii]
MEKKSTAYLAALSMSVIIGFSFLTNKISLDTASPWAILAHRFTFAFLALLALKVLGFMKFRLTRKEVFAILPLSLFYPLLFFSLQLLGLQKVYSSEAGIIQAMTPLLTMILATLILKEKTKRMQKLFMLVSLSGVVYISLVKGAEVSVESLTGYLLLLLSSFSSAMNLVLIRKLVKDHSFMKLTSVAITTGFILCNLINLTLHLMEGHLESYFSPLGTPSFLLGVLFLGVLSTLGTSLLSNFALSRLEASRMSIFNHLGTVISIFAGVLLLREHLRYYQVIGALLIITGVIGTNYFAADKRENRQKA